MLVLSRKQQEEVILSMGGAVIGSVRVVEVRDNTVRLGFQGFDRTIRIDRREIFDKNQETDDAANQQDGTAQDQGGQKV